MGNLLQTGKTMLKYLFAFDAITSALKSTPIPGSNLKAIVDKLMSPLILSG